MEQGHFSVIEDAECRELLRLGAVGRIAWSSGERVSILPVTYAVTDGAIRFRTSAESVLSTIDGPVAFEVDDVDVETRTGWSVVVHGTAQRTDGRAEVEPWAPGARDVVMQVSIDHISGRSVSFGELGEVDVYV